MATGGGFWVAARGFPRFGIISLIENVRINAQRMRFYQEKQDVFTAISNPNIDRNFKKLLRLPPILAGNRSCDRSRGVEVRPSVV